MTNKRSPVF